MTAADLATLPVVRSANALADWYAGAPIGAFAIYHRGLLAADAEKDIDLVEMSELAQRYCRDRRVNLFQKRLEPGACAYLAQKRSRAFLGTSIGKTR